MKNSVIIVLGLFLSSACYASNNWVKVIENEEVILFLDKDSITNTKIKNVKQAKLILNNKKNSYSTVTLYEINCKSKQDHRIKLFDYEQLNAQGRLLGSLELDEPMEAADPTAVDLICH